MKRHAACFFALLLSVFFVVCRCGFAVAQEIQTTIDYSYTFKKTTSDDEVTNAKSFAQKYQASFSSTLNYFYSISSRLSADYSVSQETGNPVRETLTSAADMRISSDKLTLLGSFNGTKSSTEAIHDEPAITTYSSSYLVEASGKPRNLPQFKLNASRNRSFEEEKNEKVTNKLNLDLKYKLAGVSSAFKYEREKENEILPETFTSESATWEWTLNFGGQLSRLLDYQFDYSINENLTQDSGVRGVFISENKDYTQKLSTSFKSVIDLLPDLPVALGYDFIYDQDLLDSAYDDKVTQKISASTKKDILSWINLAAGFAVSNENIYNVEGMENTEKVQQLANASVRLAPSSWVDWTTRIDHENTTEFQALTGGDILDTRRLTVSNSMSVPMLVLSSLNLSHGYEEAYERGLLTKKNNQYRLTYGYTPVTYLRIDFNYGTGISHSYRIDRGFSERDTSTRDWTSGLKLALNQKFLDFIQFRAEYGFEYSFSEDLDYLSNLTEEASLNENALLSLVVRNFIRGMTFNFDVSRKASDSLDDEESLIVDRSLSARLNWSLPPLEVALSYKFDDPGDGDNTLSFGSKVAWKEEFYEITGEYTYDKTFADLPNDSKSYSLKFSMRF